MIVRENKVLTLPNLLSAFRLFIVPFLTVFLLQGQKNTAAALWLLSGLTDLADGYFARKLNQVTALGKILDPVADKLTQISLLLGLCPTVPTLTPLLAFLLLKESVLLAFGTPALRRAGAKSSRWHGKAAATVLFVLIGYHLLAPTPNPTVSLVLILSSLVSMTVSALLYVGNFLVLSDRDGSVNTAS